MRGVAHGGILTGERQFARDSVYLENSDVVCSLIAAVQEFSCGIKAEAARVIAAGPFIGHPGQFALWAD